MSPPLSLTGMAAQVKKWLIVLTLGSVATASFLMGRISTESTEAFDRPMAVVTQAPAGASSLPGPEVGSSLAPGRPARAPGVEVGAPPPARHEARGKAAERRRFELLAAAAASNHVVLPSETELTDKQWRELDAVHAEFCGRIDQLMSAHRQRLSEITELRRATGGLEIVSIGLPDKSTAEAVRKASKPNVKGQQIQLVSGPDGTMINRVNQGEDAELDRILEELRVTQLLYVDAAARTLRP